MILGSFDLVLTGGSGERGVNTTSLYLIKIHTGVKLSTAHSTAVQVVPSKLCVVYIHWLIVYT